MKFNISDWAEKYQYIMPIISAVITGLITWWAMWFIDNQAKKRWLNEGYQRREVELNIEIRKILLNIKKETDEFPSKNEFYSLVGKESFDENDRKNLEQIFRTFGIIKDNLKKPECDIKTIFDEYSYFNKTNENSLNLFKKYYKDFFKINGFIYRSEISKQKETLKFLYDFKGQLEAVLKII